jgi:hypothetical protein
VSPADSIVGGIRPDMNEQTAQIWASRRWGCEARTRFYAHPTSIGDWIAEVLVTDGAGRPHRGIGYSGMAPLGATAWAKACSALALQEPGVAESLAALPPIARP